MININIHLHYIPFGAFEKTRFRGNFVKLTTNSRGFMNYFHAPRITYIINQ